MTNENTARPAAIPFDSELARRAEQPRYAVDRVISAVAYHAGPEMAAGAALGVPAWLLIDPAAAAAVGALIAAYRVIDAWRQRRQSRATQARRAVDTPPVEADDTAADAARTERTA